MSIPATVPPPAFYPNGYNPYSLDPTQILMSMQNNALTSNIYDSTTKTTNAVNDAQRLLTSEITGVNKNIFDTIAQNAVSIERTGANAVHATERNATQITQAVERNGGNITTAIERVAGEGRLTTTVTDAASRQAANDSARDILRAVDRVGSDATANIKDTHNGLLGAIERNAGENRVQTLTSAGQTDFKLADIRHAILNDVNRSANELLGANTQNLNSITKSVTDAAWEARSGMAAGFQNVAEEHLRTKHDLASQAGQQYASLLLENQKLAHFSDKQHDNHFAAMISKTDNHFATLLLEQQKVKECLAQQAAQNFAVSQLENQKIRESITLQLQEAKYEALKNKNELSKELGDCCCEIKQKVDQRTQDVIGVVDTLDRNRLRDEVNTTNNENNLLKFMEFGPWGYGGYGYGGYGGRGRGSRGRRDGEGR